MADRRNILIIVLAIIVVILALVMIYAFIIQPAVSGYSVQKQTEGVQIAINSILSQLQQNGFVQIPIGNQTLILVPYQAPQTTQPAETTTQGTTTGTAQ